MIRLSFRQQAYLRYAFKGAMIVLLSLVSAYLLGIKQDYWVLFGAITVTKIHQGVSFHRGKQRVLGTIIGVGLSLFLTVWLWHWPWGLAFIIPLCIFGAVYYFSEYAVCMVFITIIFVLTISISSHHPLHYAVARIFDTLLGVSLAIMISSYLWPSRAKKVIQHDFDHYFSEIDRVFLILTKAALNKRLSTNEKDHGGFKCEVRQNRLT